MRRFAVAGLLLLLTGAAAPAQDDMAQRQARIAAERAALADRVEREAAECRQRFAVTPCLDEVRRRQRQAQASLDAEQRTIDEARRAQRLAERQAEVDRKQAEVARRAATPASAAAPPSAPASRQPVEPVPPRKAPSDAAAKAAARAEAARQLQAEIQADQARIRERQARRAASGKPVHPLPAPPGGAASAPR